MFLYVFCSSNLTPPISINVFLCFLCVGFRVLSPTTPPTMAPTQAPTKGTFALYDIDGDGFIGSYFGVVRYRRYDGIEWCTCATDFDGR